MAAQAGRAMAANPANAAAILGELTTIPRTALGRLRRISRAWAGGNFGLQNSRPKDLARHGSSPSEMAMGMLLSAQPVAANRTF